jgi:hypothetical protein
MKRKYIVSTHLGEFPTWATSPQKAINNIRFRIFGRTADSGKTIYWTARAA